ncbi:hypothetical protein [Secundilactobacillus collinoides]|uniref:Uncharacterized protein n=1 Tax=Secundilactobacillus collinoides TaxID=33960 RepID=A0A166GXU7_SECCO|nr:hypothetical protein [Secundilactobacillus collinoides]KZL41018.1 hypothetical protein TY91_07135 [Secundilactobacillus collinoides]
MTAERTMKNLGHLLVVVLFCAANCDSLAVRCRKLVCAPAVHDAVKVIAAVRYLISGSSFHVSLTAPRTGANGNRFYHAALKGDRLNLAG